MSPADTQNKLHSMIYFCSRDSLLLEFLDDLPEAVVLFFPMYHISGLVCPLVTLLFGKTLVLMSKFDFKQYLELISKYKVS